MALKNCKECNQQISTGAKACPHCGAPQKKKTSIVTYGCLVLLAIVLIPALLVSLFKSDKQPTTTTKTPKVTQPVKKMTPIEHFDAAQKLMDTKTYKEDAFSDSGLDEIERHLRSISSTSPQYAAAQKMLQEVTAKRDHIKAKALGLTWNYSTSQDDMGRGEIKFAEVSSTNTVNFAFPYQGEQRATLTLRKHPKHGNDVMLQLTKGQFLCDSWDGCPVSVRFGEGKAQTFTAMPPSSQSTTVLFIQNYARFLSSLKKVDKVSIEAQFYQEGAKAFHFETSGLKW